MNLFDDETVTWMEVPQAEVSAEDALEAECVTLEDAGLEERDKGLMFGADSQTDGVMQVVAWWSDGEDARDWLTQ